MDIDLLSKMVKELILDDDRVVLPGLGCFVAEVVPATFSDKGYTINPPYRRLYFRARPDEGDVLIEFYAKSNNIEYDMAEKIVKDFLVELKSILHLKKTVVFPGLGRLRATKENNLFFVADEDLDIYPAGFGLESISLKTHQESRAEVSAAVAGLKNILAENIEVVSEPTPVPTMEPEPSMEPVPTMVSEPTPEPETIAEPVSEAEPIFEPTPEPEVVSEPEPANEPEPESEPEVKSEVVVEQKKTSAPVIKALLVVLAVLVALVLAYMAVGRLCPELLDSLLYTPEELEILNR